MRGRHHRHVSAVQMGAVVLVVGLMVLPTGATAAQSKPTPKPPLSRTAPASPGASETHAPPSDGSSTAQAAQAWECNTDAFTPYYSYGWIVGHIWMHCNVYVNHAWVYACIQVSNDNVNFWDQQGTCQWTESGPTFELHNWPQWRCIGNNVWYYRSVGYSYKVWPDGYGSYSPWASSYSLRARC